MKKLSKKLLSILSLTMFGLLFANAPTTSAETLENENLVKLEYTIDEIKAMSLGEYYQNIFPETFDEFTAEQKEELFDTPYSTQTLNERNRIIDGALMTVSSTLSKVSSSEIRYSAKTQMNFTDGSKAKKIHHSSIIYDDKGFNIKDDRLGVAISHGCIRLATSSAKWIYDNIPEGTPIIINWYI